MTRSFSRKRPHWRRTTAAPSVTKGTKSKDDGRSGARRVSQGLMSKIAGRKLFEVLDYIDDRGVCPQNVIVARKRRA
jgi:hypothetical protein